MNATNIEACGGVVVRNSSGKSEILAIFRRGYWDLPKGKREEGESLEQCAIREVSEETGVTGLSIINDLGTTVHHYSELGVMIHKTTYWYLMITDSDGALTPQSEEDIESVVWMDFEEAYKRVGFQNLKIVLSRARNII